MADPVNPFQADLLERLNERRERQAQELQKMRERTQQTPGIQYGLAGVVDALAGAGKGTQLDKLQQQRMAQEAQLAQAEGDYDDTLLQAYKANQPRSNPFEMFLAKEEYKEKKGKPLTDAALGQLSDLEDQLAGADDLLKDWEANVLEQRKGDDFFNRLGSSLSSMAVGGGTPEAMYEGNRKLKAQMIGKSIEGGKLTDVDYEKYLKFIPGPMDSREAAHKKIKDLKKALKSKRVSMVSTYEKGGKDVRKFTQPEVNMGAQIEQKVKQYTPEQAASRRAELLKKKQGM